MKRTTSMIFVAIILRNAACLTRESSLQQGAHFMEDARLTRSALLSLFLLHITSLARSALLSLFLLHITSLARSALLSLFLLHITSLTLFIVPI
ncbi:hypothetical protein BJ742DRAFT_793970 [Cladochytrium replicatum]|nr:hypothetical protein BJ742DRAFT_793970 [Cladochytrium replicatum]